MLGQQTEFLRSTIAKLSRVGGQLPGVSVVLSRIRRKKTRDALIMGAFVGLLTCFLLWYWLSS